MTKKREIYIESPESERKYRKLATLGKELGVPVPQAFLEMQVTMPDGRVVHHHKQRSHSWTRNAYNALFSMLAGKDLSDGVWGGGYLNLMMTTGFVISGAGPGLLRSERTLDTWDTITRYGYMAQAAETSHGIVVGSGTDAEDFEDYALQTQIAGGIGPGQLNHVASNLHDISYDAVSKVLKDELSRFFNNNSEGNVDINEVALYFKGYSPGATSFREYCMSRDLLAATVTVPDTGQLKVTYTIELTYPA